MTPIIPRGTVIGKQTSGPPLSEAEHFHKCEACGGWFDMRDLGAVTDSRFCSKMRQRHTFRRSIVCRQASVGKKIAIC